MGLNQTIAINIQHALNRCFPIAKIVALGDRINAFINAHNSQMLISAALAIKAGNLTFVTGAASLANVGGSVLNGGVALVPIANATSMPALVGTIPVLASGITTTGIWAFYIDNGGNITQQFVTGNSVTNALINFPPTNSLPVPTTLIGFATVTNASTTVPFVGGTTALNAANVTTTIYSVIGGVSNMIALQNSNNRPSI